MHHAPSIVGQILLLNAVHCRRPQEDVLLQHVSGEQLVFDAVVEGVLQLLQVGCDTPVCGQSF